MTSCIHLFLQSWVSSLTYVPSPFQIQEEFLILQSIPLCTCQDGVAAFKLLKIRRIPYFSISSHSSSQIVPTKDIHFAVHSHIAPHLVLLSQIPEFQLF